MRKLYRFIADIWISRKILFELARKDFQARYLGSYLGILWAFIQPTAYIGILWFVFQIGFKTISVKDFPFILWLIAGLIPWFFIAESIANATNAIAENSYLVKKVVFRIGMLPLVKILSSLFVHLLLIVIMILVYVVYGHFPDRFFIQIPYYIGASIMLVLGISFITSAVMIFIKDLAQLIAILLQFCFWLTPIFWPISLLPPKYHIIIKLNPVFYIIEGYRNCFVYKIWFWQEPLLTIYFWIVTGMLCVIGALFFLKVKPHFADVL